MDQLLTGYERTQKPVTPHSALRTPKKPERAYRFSYMKHSEGRVRKLV